MSLTIPGYVKKMIKEGMPRKKVNQYMSRLERCVDDIFSNVESTIAYQVLYDQSVELVRNKHGERLYSSIKRAFRKHSKLLLSKVSDLEEAVYLRSCFQYWMSYRLNIRKTKDLFLFLDENYVEKKSTHETPILSLYEMGILTFQREVVKTISPKLRSLLLGMIEKERNGELICDKFLLKNVCKMMVEIDRDSVYREEFEDHLITSSTQYFRNEAIFWFENSTACEYLRKVLKRLNEEKQRAKRCFHEDTLGRLEFVIHHEMITNYKNLIIQKEGSGLLQMLSNKKLDELRLVYEVLSKVPDALVPSKDMFQKYIIQEGFDLIKTENKSYLSLVLKIINLRVFYEHVLEHSFSKNLKGAVIKDPEFQKALKHSFGEIVNKNDRFPEYLSLLLDKKLRSNKVSDSFLSDDETNLFFDHVIMTFQHVKEKDIFEKYYKSHLAKRLLSHSMYSKGNDDNERLFLSKLKTSFGYQFTSKLEGMFKDIKISQELMNEWKEYKIRNPNNKNKNNLKQQKESTSSTKNICIFGGGNSGDENQFDLNVQILTSVYWPIGKIQRCIISEAYLNGELERFHKFYDEKHNGRKLTWQFNMGTADVRANGYAKKYEFSVTTYQMVILLLFNNIISSASASASASSENNEKENQRDKELSLKGIHERTKITVQELKKNLFALCLPNQKNIPMSRLILKRSDKPSQENMEGIDFQNSPPVSPLTPKTPAFSVNPKSRFSKQQVGSSSQVKVVKKKSKLELTTRFRPNEKFRSQKMKIKVLPVIKREDSNQRDVTREKIDEERRWVIDACIVRIMKMRKHLRHRNLIMEVVQQLQARFEPRPDSIKKRIESLIDRDYLERDEEDRAVYKYLA